MSYGFIAPLLIAHFPRQNEIGDLWCACGEYEDFDQDEGAPDRWAEHVEVAYNALPTMDAP